MAKRAKRKPLPPGTYTARLEKLENKILYGDAGTGKTAIGLSFDIEAPGAGLMGRLVAKLADESRKAMDDAATRTFREATNRAYYNGETPPHDFTFRQQHSVGYGEWKTSYTYPHQRRFADLLAPDLKNVYIKTLQEAPMAYTFYTKVSSKKLVPRTKREKALVAQAVEAAREEAYNQGFGSGLVQGRDQERQRGEKLLATLIEAQARGFRS